MQCVLKLVLITPVFTNCPEISISRLIEAIFDVVVPNHSIPDYPNYPKSSTDDSIIRLRPFMRRNANALPQLCFRWFHSRFCRQDQIPKLRLRNRCPIH